MEIQSSNHFSYITAIILAKYSSINTKLSSPIPCTLRKPHFYSLQTMASSSTTSITAALVVFFLLSSATTSTGEPFACDPKDATTGNSPFCQVSLPISQRVQDLIGKLTMQEKVKLLVNNAAAVPRLGIKGYEWWSEALHGVSNVGPGTKFGGDFPGATSFPQVITTAASFNATLWEAIGRVRFSYLLLKLIKIIQENSIRVPICYHT